MTYLSTAPGLSDDIAAEALGEIVASLNNLLPEHIRSTVIDRASALDACIWWCGCGSRRFGSNPCTVCAILPMRVAS